MRSGNTTRSSLRPKQQQRLDSLPLPFSSQCRRNTRSSRSSLQQQHIVARPGLRTRSNVTTRAGASSDTSQPKCHDDSDNDAATMRLSSTQDDDDDNEFDNGDDDVESTETNDDDDDDWSESSDDKEAVAMASVANEEVGDASSLSGDDNDDDSVFQSSDDEEERVGLDGAADAATIAGDLHANIDNRDDDHGKSGGGGNSSISNTTTTFPVGFDPNNKHHVRWEAMFAQLLEFQRQFGHTVVPSPSSKTNGNIGSGTSGNDHGNHDEYKWYDLYHWTKLQRYRLPRMTTEVAEKKRQLLEALGFSWIIRAAAKERQSDHDYANDVDQRHERWKATYKRLYTYHAQFGHANVPTRYSDDPALGRWVQRQRRQLGMVPVAAAGDGDGDDLGISAAVRVETADTILPVAVQQERRDLLNALGFCWEGNTTTTTRRKCADIAPRHSRHRRRGRTSVILATNRWNKRLSCTGIPSGRSFESPKSCRVITTKWKRHFAEVKAFKDKFGHCLVDSQDYKWSELGCRWNRPPAAVKAKQAQSPSSPSELWMKNLSRLQHFKDTFGHCHVPCIYHSSVALYVWKRSQKVRLIQNPPGQALSPLEQAQKNLLDAVDPSWHHYLRPTWKSKMAAALLRQNALAGTAAAMPFNNDVAATVAPAAAVTVSPVAAGSAAVDASTDPVAPLSLVTASASLTPARKRSAPLAQSKLRSVNFKSAKRICQVTPASSSHQSTLRSTTRATPSTNQKPSPRVRPFGSVVTDLQCGSLAAAGAVAITVSPEQLTRAATTTPMVAATSTIAATGSATAAAAAAPLPMSIATSATRRSVKRSAPAIQSKINDTTFKRAMRTSGLLPAVAASSLSALRQRKTRAAPISPKPITPPAVNGGLATRVPPRLGDDAQDDDNERGGSPVVVATLSSGTSALEEHTMLSDLHAKLELAIHEVRARHDASMQAWIQACRSDSSNNNNTRTLRSQGSAATAATTPVARGSCTSTRTLRPRTTVDKLIDDDLTGQNARLRTEIAKLEEELKACLTSYRNVISRRRELIQNARDEANNDAI